MWATPLLFENGPFLLTIYKLGRFMTKVETSEMTTGLPMLAVEICMESTS